MLNLNLFPPIELALMIGHKTVCLPGMLRALSVVVPLNRQGKADLYWWRATGDLPRGFVLNGRPVRGVVEDSPALDSAKPKSSDRAKTRARLARA